MLSFVRVRGHGVATAAAVRALRARAPVLCAARMMSGGGGDGVRGGYEFITSEKLEGGVGLITLNRPKALNALCDALMQELIAECQAYDADDDVGAIVVTGSEKAFAAGAAINEMAPKSFTQVREGRGMFHDWTDITRISKPTIAAVNGYALGGGCELAMMLDMIIAGSSAKFAQPEIKLGVIAGGGGTQRLTHAVGKSLSMYMNLTGEMINAERAERAGLVAEVVPKEETVDRAVEIGRMIAGYSRPVVAICKEAVNRSFETSLEEGTLSERRAFHSCFALEDQTEGMSAFLEKREPEWRHR